jgi:hypothetical protein
MTRRTLQHTLAATVAASALVTAPALARPAGETPTASPGGLTWSPGQVLTPADVRQAARQAKVEPTAPTWPEHPTPLSRVAPPAEPSTGSGGGDDTWLVLGLGLGGACLVAGGAAGIARHTRVRARRVAV